MGQYRDSSSQTSYVRPKSAMYTPRRDDEHHRYLCMGKRSIAKRMKRIIPYLKFSSDLISHGVFVVVVVVVLAFLELNSFIFVILAITLVEE